MSARSPDASRSLISVVRKSPGGSWMMMKVMTEIRNRVGTMSSRRWMR
jgi:hypothetical protein